jgi:hypothetical protein
MLGQEEPARLAKEEQRRGDGHQHQMLEHVGGEQRVVEPGQR